MTTYPRLMRRIASGVLALSTAAALASCSCSRNEPTYVGICVDPTTQIRMPDNYCNGHQDYWYYYGPGYVAPPVNSRATGGTRTPPAKAQIQKNVPAAGGTAPAKPSASKPQTGAPKPGVDMQKTPAAPKPQAPAPKPPASKGK